MTALWTETAGVRAQDADIVIAVDGDDARTWLNGQITNDLKRLSPDHGVYGLVLTTKGRVLADVLGFERGGGVFFATNRGVWPALREQLEKYIIMEDVTLRETSLRVITVLGARAGEIDLSTVLAGMDASIVTSDRLGAGRDVIVEQAVYDDVHTLLVAAAQAVGGSAVDDAAWELARISAGVPRFSVDFGEKTYPQEAGLKDRAVSFEKGCYLGQEVVCMLENRGQLSRTLVRVRLSSGAPAGSALRRGEDSVGELTSVAGEHGLAMVKRAHAEPGTSLDTDHGSALVVGVVS